MLDSLSCIYWRRYQVQTALSSLQWQRHHQLRYNGVLLSSSFYITKKRKPTQIIILLSHHVKLCHTHEPRRFETVCRLPWLNPLNLDLNHVSRDLNHVSRDLHHVSRDLNHVSRDFYRLSQSLFSWRQISWNNIDVDVAYIMPPHTLYCILSARLSTAQVVSMAESQRAVISWCVSRDWNAVLWVVESLRLPPLTRVWLATRYCQSLAPRQSPGIGRC